MAHDPVLVENAAAWLRKAWQDLRRVERCLTDEPPDVEDALFHCQQAAEKALKAFLIWHHCCPGDDFFIPRRRLMARQLSHI